MALPTITFNDTTGSDTQASGAGPAAVFGTAARVSATTPNKIGFFEGFAPALGSVVTDGSHVLWLEQAAGRRWFKITAVKDTQQVTTGNMTSGSAVVSSMGSTTGMSATDVVRVIGAGAAGADLYADIVTVDSSTQITLDTNAGTTVTGNEVRCPKQVDSDQAPSTTSSNLNWAIGGSRLTLANATQMWADLAAGWKVAFAWVDGGPGYTVTATSISLTVAGDTTNGRVKICGVLGPNGERPIIRNASAANDIFIANNVILLSFEGIDFEVCDEAIRVSGTSTDYVIDNCRFNANAENTVTQPLVLSGTSFTWGINIRGCYFRGLSGTSIADSTAGVRTLIHGCHFGPAPGGTYTAYSKTSATPADVRDCCFDAATTGVALGSNATVATNSIVNCTFLDCGTCISAGNIAQCRGLVITNNIFANGSTGVSLVAGADNAAAKVDYNNFYSLDTDRVNVSAGANDVDLDHQIWEMSSGVFSDWRVGLNMRGLGWPRTFPVGLTTSAIDLGASQRAEAVGGNIIFRVSAATDVGNAWVLDGVWVGGVRNGQGDSITVDKDLIPASTVPHLGAVIASLQAYLRDAGGANVVNKEFLA